MNDTHREAFSFSAAFFGYELALAAGLICIFAPYATFKMIRMPSFRAGIARRLSLPADERHRNPSTDPIWIQAVSLGEVKSVSPLVKKIEESGKRPVFITATTDTGIKAADDLLSKQGSVAYFPMDFSYIVKKALRHVRPRAIVLFETEIWPNFLRGAISMGIPVLIVNGRISEKSFRYYRIMRGLLRNVLSRISFAGMQTEKDAERLIALGARPELVRVFGNVKFDSAPVEPASDKIEGLRKELGLSSDEYLIVGGSTHEGEEAALLDMYHKILPTAPRTRLLIAPRHPERFDAVERLIQAFGLSVHRRSEDRQQSVENSKPVLLLDTIGELAQVYALASISFVGGSLAKIGGHNIVEPASMGKPVLFGPFMNNFAAVKEAFLLERAAICLDDKEELIAVVKRLLENPSEARILGEAAKRVVENNRGATDRYFQAIHHYF